MKILLESTFQEAIPKIKKGDVLEVNTDKKQYYNIIASSGQEIIVQKDGKTYLLRKNAYHNKRIEFFIKGDKDFNKKGHVDNVRFIRILRNNKPIEWITDSETENDRSAIKKNLNVQVRKQAERKFEFIKDIQGLNVGDTLTITVGLIKPDGSISQKSRTDINFLVMGLPKKNNYYLEYIDSEGEFKDKYNSFEGIDLLLISPQSPIINSHDDTIKVVLFGKGKNYSINNVVELNKTKNDNSVNVTKDDILNNKYFRDAMIKDASWLRKLFGSNIPKGIIPAMQRLSGGSNVSKYDNRIKKGNRILFKVISDEIGIGSARISNEKKYYARIKDNFTFKIPLKGEDFKAYASFNITGKNNLRKDTYNVDIDLIKDERGFNDVTNKHKGKIQIIKYNYL